MLHSSADSPLQRLQPRKEQFHLDRCRDRPPETGRLLRRQPDSQYNPVKFPITKIVPDTIMLATIVMNTPAKAMSFIEK